MANNWISFEQAFPDDNETVWLYNIENNDVALGCVCQGEDSDWCFGVLQGREIYAKNGKIVVEAEPEDYDFTHWCRLPDLPTLFTEPNEPTDLETALTLLRELAELQNGAPLERNKEEYEQTMQKVWYFLEQHKS